MLQECVLASSTECNAAEQLRYSNICRMSSRLLDVHNFCESKKFSGVRVMGVDGQQTKSFESEG